MSIRAVIQFCVVAISLAAAPVFADEEGEHEDEGGMHAGHWMAPAEAQQRRNPVPVTPEALAEAAEVYAETCSICHGPEGKGDGDAAEGLDPKPADFSRMVPIHPDGDLAWKIEHGRGTMPAWGEMLDEVTIWQLVNYLRHEIAATTASAETGAPATATRATVNLSHEAITALGWPAMTMDMALLGGADARGLEPGQEVDFELARGPDGVYGVSAIWPAGKAPPPGADAVRGHGTLNAIAGE